MITFESVLCGILFVMYGSCCMPFSSILVVNPGSPGLESSVLVSSYGSSGFSSVITERSEKGLYDVHMLMFLLDFGMMIANCNVCGMMLLFGAMLYILVTYGSPSGLMCLGDCYLLYQATWSCYFCFVVLPLGLVLW